MILGTLAYMSPEQARGRPIDLRGDIWAFGCVLYELLTGHMAFPGETASDTVASVLKNDPNWSLLPADTPQDLQRLLRRCLAKHLKDRLHHADDLRILLEEVAASLHAVPQTVNAKRPSRVTTVWASISGLLLLTAAVRWLPIAKQPPPTDAQLVRYLIYPPDASTFAPAGLAIAPDGKNITYVLVGKGRRTLWVHNLASGDSRKLEGTDGAASPFWSPDSGSIGFTAQGKLKTVDLSGGIPRTLCDAPELLLGTWGGDGSIVFGISPTGPDAVLYKTTAQGGAAVPLSRFDPARQEHTHNTPGSYVTEGAIFIPQD
jgi:eukaryotic-like serine/threonine-protein kinase